MLIDENLLLKYGAEYETFGRGKIIFDEGDTPTKYYQITKGRIKLNHYNEEEKKINSGDFRIWAKLFVNFYYL